jgi:hypothetical protein
MYSLISNEYSEGINFAIMSIFISWHFIVSSTFPLSLSIDSFIIYICMNSWILLFTTGYNFFLTLSVFWFFFFGGMGFEVRASHVLGRRSTA